MEIKVINVYYKGTNQTIKYYGKFDVYSIKITIKQIFKIEDPIEQIYFQDSDGDILALNDQTPSGISVYIYVEPDKIPKNPQTALKVDNKNENLIKFHWVKFTDPTINNDLDVIKDKYIYKNTNKCETHPGAKSSCVFEKGRHFCVFRKPHLGAYSAFGFVDNNKNSLYENGKELDRYTTEIGIFHGYPEDRVNDIYTKNLGIYIDMDKKICRFYDYDQKAKMKIYVFQSIFYHDSKIIYIREAFMRPRDMIVLKHKTPEKNLRQSLLCLFRQYFQGNFLHLLLL